MGQLASLVKRASRPSLANLALAIRQGTYLQITDPIRRGRPRSERRY